MGVTLKNPMWSPLWSSQVGPHGERFRQLDEMERIYQMCNRHSLRETDGRSGQNLTLRSVPKIQTLLRLDQPTAFEKTVGWFGCGDGRELFCLARAHPDVHFVGFEVDSAAVAVATQVLQRLGLSNVELRQKYATDNETAFTHVYSTAIGAPGYHHIRRMSKHRLCMLRSMWETDLPEVVYKETVHLSGSGEAQQLIAN